MGDVDQDRETRRASIPPQYREVFDRAMSGMSRRAAIAAHCLECVGWNEDAAHACDAQACPLWPYRPGGGRGMPGKRLSWAERLRLASGSDRRDTGSGATSDTGRAACRD